MSKWYAGKNNLAVNDRFITDEDGNVVVYCDGPLKAAKGNAIDIARWHNEHIQEQKP